MFYQSNEQLEKLGATITTREIKQQPELWHEAYDYFKAHQDRIAHFMKQVLPTTPVRVIFTGAGTSAYVGDTILPHVKEFGNEQRFDFQSVPTTTLLSNPTAFFKKEIPTVLVSFARSGNSPESVASVQLGQQIVNDFYQITITCAPEGKLAQYAEGDERNLLLLMPERSNDQGFAMTGSYTCMTLTALMLFDDQLGLDEKSEVVNLISQMGEAVIERVEEIEQLLAVDYQRVIYLGSGSLAGLAREVQLKILELTAGQTATAFDSSLGFRHGPKSFVNEDALAFIFLSNQSYTRQYDVDMLQELYHDQIAREVVAFGVGQIDYEGPSFMFDAAYQAIPDAYLALPYAMIGQTIGLLSAIKVNNKPDTPSPTGTVNRVVKGVIIHPLEDDK